MSERIRVILVDDHALVRESLANWLRDTGEVEVLAQAGTADEGLAETVHHQPAVVLMDVDMPGLLCFDAARTIRARCPATRVVFLSGFFHDRYIEEALGVEAAGYLTKGEPPETVLRAIRAAASGAAYFSPEVQARIVIDASGARLADDANKTRASTLTQRELEVLRYIAKGLSKKDIAAIMHLSVKTVDNHSTSLMAKLDIHDRVELALFAVREGLAEP